MNTHVIRAALTLVFSVHAIANVHAIQLESFVQPYRSISVPAAEMGVLSAIHIREGDLVQEGQLIANLDDTVLQASKDVANASRNAASAQQAAEAERSLTEQQLRSYRELHQAGNATQREVDRAESNYWQATTRLLAVQEDRRIRELEYQRILAQIQQREIRSPVKGVVIERIKELGEFVSPTDPVVAQIADLDRLKSVFSVPLSQIDQWEINQRIQLQVGSNEQTVMGVIERISAVADAESASVRVTVRMDNRDRKIRSGVVCRWDLEARPAELKSARSPGSMRAAGSSDAVIRQ